MNSSLSIGLQAKIKDALRESEGPELYWGYDDCLTDKQINRILALPEGMSEVEMEINDEQCHYISELEDGWIRDLLKEHLTEIAEEWDCEEEDITDEQLDDLADQYDFRWQGPGINLNIGDLVRNTRPKVVLQLRLYHEHAGYNWREAAEYGDVRDALALFNVNPRTVHRSYPNLPYRNGHEYLLPKDLVELWDNASYGGQYVMPINLNLLDYQAKRDLYHTGIILHKGDEIWLHDYFQGSGSISIPLQKDLTIKKSELEYYFGDDNDTAGYGLNAVYGLCSSAWDNDITPLQTAKPTPQTLQAARAVVQHLIYGNAITDWQISTFIRPYNEFHPKHSGGTPAPGEMLEWDIRHSLWKSFPYQAKRFLREQADRNASHVAFKFREIIGQVMITHCQFIVDHETGDVVWSTVTDSVRSYDIFRRLAARVKMVRSGRR